MPSAHMKTTRKPTFFREWRKFRKLTQIEAADLLEVDQSTISRLERREIPYDQDILERMALVYGCHEPYDLLSINPLKPDKPRLVYDALKNAPEPVQEQALAILNAFLKAS